MVRNLLFLSCFFWPYLSLSQDYIFDKEGKTKTDQQVYKEGSEKRKSVLLVPYKPVMHLPDPAGDMELVKKSGKTYDEMQGYFRMGLDFSLLKELRAGFTVHSLLNKKGPEVKEDINRVYYSVRYNYADRPVEEKQELKANIKELVKPIGEKRKKDQNEITTTIKEGQLVGERVNRDKQFMKLKIVDSTLLPFLQAKYEVDFFVFINQLEVKKSFAQGADVAYSNYGRTVKVHYSILDKEGKEVYGNVEIIQIDSKADNLNEIINSSFPVLSQNIFGHVPGAFNKTEMMELQKEYQKKAEKQNILKKE